MFTSCRNGYLIVFFVNVAFNDGDVSHSVFTITEQCVTRKPTISILILDYSCFIVCSLMVIYA